jgi:aspartyl-tRNA(Asn)/glutamyl-tRNA(Gln) amidotransferase subunit B
MTMQYETVIGLEVHVQLSTQSKIFCGASAEFGGEPNQYVDPLTLGLPGTLPVCNRRAVECALMLGLATGCEVRPFSRFARKHYFYPDLPKGYQISQYDEPICERGKLEIQVDDGQRTIGITRIHLEEDAGKNIHDVRTHCSLVDLNRAGVPLLEVVSQPDLRSPAEASAYLKTLRQLVRFLGVSDGNMEEGSLRCDANVSLRPIGSLKFGTRTEIKNINSFRYVERALEYEVARQLATLKSGNSVQQETVLFDSASGTTRPMRSKEESADYRYFPDPDLPPLVIEESWLRRIQQSMPLLPKQRYEQLIGEHGLSSYDASLLVAERETLEYFEQVLKVCNNAKAACNWITSELFGALNRAGTELSQSPIAAQQLGELVVLVDSERISGKMAKAVFEEMFSSGKSPELIVKEKGLSQVTDQNAIAALVDQVFANNASQLAEFVGGNDRLLGYFVGQLMKLSGGTVNPRKANELVLARVKKLRE